MKAETIIIIIKTSVLLFNELKEVTRINRNTLKKVIDPVIKR